MTSLPGGKGVGGGHTCTAFQSGNPDPPGHLLPLPRDRSRVTWVPDEETVNSFRADPCQYRRLIFPDRDDQHISGTNELPCQRRDVDLVWHHHKGL